MAKIALRVYNNEISDLIDHGQLDEAIAHCRHILEVFPRHIETYRLFGKSYLEGNRYGDAADILQRVISSVPDDFVSQIGMSIIREDEGDLDAAIYHMERTFEAQPSNQAIQEELRRLYGRRDGVEPAKIRLTRGALARMYAHGNLFEQAVAELSASLSDDPSRLDLTVLLAEMYFKMDKHVETADLCINILEKLPNNLSANRILYFILSGSNRIEESDVYKQVWISLDPYVEFLESDNTDPSAIPDNAVTIEKLIWDPELYEDQQKDRPDWGSSLGVTLENDEDTSDKNWLFSPDQVEDNLEDTAPVSVKEVGDDSLSNETKDNDDVVMEWAESDSGELIDNAESSESEGEIPDWIMEGVVESDDAKESLGNDFPDMVKDFELAQELDSVPSSDEYDDSILRDKIEAAYSDNEEEKSEEKSSSPIEMEFEGLDDLDIPENITDDWIDELEEKENKSEEETEKSSEADTIRFNTEVSKDTPDWLKDLSDTGKHIRDEKEEIPEWLKNSDDLEESNKVESDEIPSWLNELGDIESIAEQVKKGQPDSLESGEDSTENDEPDDETDWLKSLSAAETAIDTISDPLLSDIESISVEDEEENVLAGLESQGTEDDKFDDSFPELSAIDISESDKPSDEAEDVKSIDPDDSVEWLENLGSNQDLDVGDSLAEIPEQTEIPDIGAGPDNPNEVDDWLNSLLDELPENQKQAEDDDEWMETIADLSPKIEPQKSPADTDWLKDLDAAAISVSSEDEEQSDSAELEGIQEISTDKDPVYAETDIESNLDSEEREQAITDDMPDIVETDLPTEMTGAFTTASQDNSVEDTAVEHLDLDDVPDWMNEIVDEENSIEDKVSESDVESINDASIDWLTNQETIEEETSEPVMQEPGDLEPDLKDDENKLSGEWIPESESGIIEETPESLIEKPTPKTKVVKQISEELLSEIKTSLSKGDIQNVISGYKKLIKKGTGIEEVVDNINGALRKFPLDVNLWQALGDAFMKQDRLQDALDAYTKAGELLQ